jgi:hypothetical protein
VKITVTADVKLESILKDVSSYEILELIEEGDIIEYLKKFCFSCEKEIAFLINHGDLDWQKIARDIKKEENETLQVALNEEEIAFLINHGDLSLEKILRNVTNKV